jgi:hypothetical protein
VALPFTLKPKGRDVVGGPSTINPGVNESLFRLLGRSRESLTARRRR